MRLYIRIMNALVSRKYLKYLCLLERKRGTDRNQTETDLYPHTRSVCIPCQLSVEDLLLYNLYPSIKCLARQKLLHVPFKTLTLTESDGNAPHPHSPHAHTHTHEVSALKLFATMPSHIQMPGRNSASIVVRLNANKRSYLKSNFSYNMVLS